MTILAVANGKVTQEEVKEANLRRWGGIDDHVVTGRQYNCDGYGIVRFNKSKQQIRVESWPYDADPRAGDSAQFEGWPIVLSLSDMDGRKPVAYLPDIKVQGLPDPVVQVVNEKTGEVVYTTRAKDGFYRPGVFSRKGRYTLRVGEPGTAVGMREWNGLKPSVKPGAKTLKIRF